MGDIANDGVKKEREEIDDFTKKLIAKKIKKFLRLAKNNNGVLKYSTILKVLLELNLNDEQIGNVVAVLENSGIKVLRNTDSEDDILDDEFEDDEDDEYDGSEGTHEYRNKLISADFVRNDNIFSSPNYAYGILTWWNTDTDVYAWSKFVPCKELDEAEKTLKKMYEYEKLFDVWVLVNKDCYICKHNARLVWREKGSRKKYYQYFRIIGMLDSKHWAYDPDSLSIFDNLEYEYND